jgi:nicotinamidase/pyrazinamidase
MHTSHGTVFWDVDTQHDFMHADGKLYVPDSEAIIPNLRALTAYAHARGIRIVASADDHVPGHRELHHQPDFRDTFPEHCMRGTKGQQKIPETALRDPLVIEPEGVPLRHLAEAARAHRGDILIHKHWFDVFSNPHALTVLEALDPSDVVLYGVALDVCNRYAIDGLLRHRPGTQVHLVVDATRAIAPEKTTALLSDWERRGVRLVTTLDVLEDRVIPR